MTPRVDTATWSFTVDGLVAKPTTWSWDEIRALPASTYAGDIHCVTTWSKLGVNFSGVSVDTLLEAAGVQPTASYVLARSSTGYTTNLPLADVTGDGVPDLIESGHNVTTGEIHSAVTPRLCR